MITKTSIENTETLDECVIATIQAYEVEKLFFIVRRTSALVNLLETIDNTEIVFDEPKKLKDKIKQEIKEYSLKVQKWWDLIIKRYELESYDRKQLELFFQTREILKVNKKYKKVC